MTNKDITPSDYYARETELYPICQYCGAIIRNDDPCYYNGEPICDWCASENQALEISLETE